MKWFVWQVVGRVVVVFCALSFSQIHAETTLRLVQGKVEELDRSEHRVAISVTDQKTGLIQVFQVQIDGSTKFVKMGNLRDVKPGDMISVDFSQGRTGAFVASRIELVESVQNAEDKQKTMSDEDPEAENSRTLF